MYKLGIDIGSTTAKAIVTDDNKTILYSDYLRHNADIKGTLLNILQQVKQTTGSGIELNVTITGSAGLGIAERIGLPFIQEVMAASNYVKHSSEQINTIIDIGGEDSKIIFFNKNSTLPVMRMNGNCAGGTGSFIDQMAMALPAEIVSLARNKADGVISLQPFGCIANHVISKGVENKIKQLFPDLTLLSLDFDSGVSPVNVENRLMMLIESIREQRK